MILDKFRINGKVAIVTGSRRGLGKGIALCLAEAGADIVSFDRNDPVELRASVLALGRKHVWKQVDLLTATPEDFIRLVDDVVAEFGKLDILVNNAGICPRDTILGLLCSELAGYDPGEFKFPLVSSSSCCPADGEAGSR